MTTLIALLAVAPFVLLVVARTIRIGPQARTGVIERFGRYQEKQMRADREKRATVLNAEGVKQAQIPEAEGAKQGSTLRAEGDRPSQIVRAEGEAEFSQALARFEAEFPTVDSNGTGAVVHANDRPRP